MQLEETVKNHYRYLNHYINVIFKCIIIFNQ